jgi:selenocysteine lyase/cysteine desulfurase
LNQQIRKLFPALEQYTYLNSAAVSPLPTTAIEAVNSQLWDVATHGSSHYADWVATKNRARSIIANMLNVEAEQIAFMRNTSDGFATIANGLAWDENDNIVSFDREFPANFYAWRRVRDKFGVKLKMCPEKNGRIDIDEFISLIDENTRLVAISAVQFASGFRADLEKIGDAARKVDALFAVDIIQGLGTMPFDLPAQKVDIASGASHKWLCSPEGCGILYLSERARARVEPTLVGWISVPDPWNFKDVEQEYQPNALAWETGTGTSSLFYGLEQSLKLLNETGIENIQRHLEVLTDFLCESLPGNKYKIVSSREKGEKSQIVCVEPLIDLTSDEIFKILASEKIIVSSRNNKLRIAPHFYNIQEDIEKLVTKLP